jgi:hypothetical protein
MKRRTREFLLALALWLLGLSAYGGSLGLPWFIHNPGLKSEPILDVLVRPFGVPFQEQITGLDAFDFLLERMWGGCFVWLAHPVLYVGWMLLVACRWRGASLAGCIALALAVNAPMVFQPRVGPWFPAGLGYYLWLASMVLLACSVVFRNFFFRHDLVAEAESFRQLAARERKLAAELAGVKRQVADLVDHHAATLLEEIEARK